MDTDPGVRGPTAQDTGDKLLLDPLETLKRINNQPLEDPETKSKMSRTHSPCSAATDTYVHFSPLGNVNSFSASTPLGKFPGNGTGSLAAGRFKIRNMDDDGDDDSSDDSDDGADKESRTEVPRCQLLHEHAYSTQPRVAATSNHDNHTDYAPSVSPSITRMVSLLDKAGTKPVMAQESEIQVNDTDSDQCNKETTGNVTDAIPDYLEAVKTADGEGEKSGRIQEQDEKVGEEEQKDEDEIPEDTAEPGAKTGQAEIDQPLNTEELERGDNTSVTETDNSKDNDNEEGSESEANGDVLENKAVSEADEGSNTISGMVNGPISGHEDQHTEMESVRSSQPESESNMKSDKVKGQTSHEMECQTEAMSDSSDDDDGRLVIQDEAASGRTIITKTSENEHIHDDGNDGDNVLDESQNDTVNDTTMETNHLNESNVGGESHVADEISVVDEEKEDATLSMLCETVKESDIFPKSDDDYEVDEEEEEEEDEIIVQKALPKKRRRLNSAGHSSSVSTGGPPGGPAEWRDEYGSTKDLDGDPELFKIPFQEGWKREIVIRGVFEEFTKSGTKRAQKPADVYYFTPDGTKLRSKIQIASYLERMGSDMTEKNFSFIRRPIYKLPLEKIRMAGKNRSRAGGKRGSLDPGELLIQSPATSPTKRGRKKKKGRSPGRPRKHPLPVPLPEPMPMAKGKTYQEIMVHPPVDLMPPPEVVMERDGEEKPYEHASVSQSISESPPPVIRPKKTKPTARKSTTQSKMKSRVISHLGSSSNTSRDNHIQLTPNVDQLCGLDCPGRRGQHPSLQCGICMCLFHPECVNVLGNTRPVLFVCLRCQRAGGKPAVGSAAAVKPSASNLVLNKSNWSPIALKTATVPATVKNGNVTIKLSQPGMSVQYNSALRNCLQTRPSLAVTSPNIPRTFTVTQPSLAATSPNIPRTFTVTLPQGGAQTIYLPVSGNNTPYYQGLGQSLGGSNKVTLMTVPQLNTIANLGSIPSVVTGASPSVANVPVGLVPNISATASTVVMPNAASLIPTVISQPQIMGGVQVQNIPVKLGQQSPVQASNVVNSLSTSVANSSTVPTAATSLPPTETRSPLVTTAVTSQLDTPGKITMSVSSKSPPTIMQAPVWKPPTGTYVESCADDTRAAARNGDTTSERTTEACVTNTTGSTSLPTTPSPASTGSGSLPPLGPGLPPKLTPAPTPKPPSSNQGATPPQPPQLLKNGVAMVNSNPNMDLLRSTLMSPVIPSYNTLPITAVPVRGSELMSSVPRWVSPTVEARKDPPPPPFMLPQGQNAGQPKDAGTPAQLLTLPPAVLQRLNLKEPLALKINNTQILVPPSCFLKTDEGVKVCLPPNTLKTLSGGTSNNFMEMQVKFVGEISQAATSACNNSAQLSVKCAENSEETNNKTVPQSSNTASSCVQKSSVKSLKIRPAKRPGINTGLCYFRKLFGGFETMLKVFEYLGTKDLLRAACVCKTWKTIASQPCLWRHVDVGRLGWVEWRKAVYYLRQVNVESLNLEGYNHPVAEGDTEVNMTELLPLLSDLPNLRRLYLGEVPVTVVHQVADQLTHLTDFTAQVINNPEHRERLNLGKVCKMKGLKVLKLSRSQSTHICEEDVQACGTSNLTSLKQLQILVSGTINVCEEDVQACGTSNLTSLKQLQILSLGAVAGIADQDAGFLSEMMRLKYLEMADCSSWTSSTFFMLGQLPALEELKISGGGEIPDIGLADALSFAKKLRRLEMIDWLLADSFQYTFSQMESLESLVIQPDTSNQAAVVNGNTLAAVIRLPNLRSLDWGIVHSRDSTIILHDEHGQGEASVDEDRETQKTQCIPFLLETTDTENLTPQEIDQMTQFVSVVQLREKLRNILTDCKIHVHMCSPRITEHVTLCSNMATESGSNLAAESGSNMAVDSGSNIAAESVSMSSFDINESVSMSSSEVSDTAATYPSEFSEISANSSRDVRDSVIMSSCDLPEGVAMCSPAVSESVDSSLMDHSDVDMMEMDESQDGSIQ